MYIHQSKLQDTLRFLLFFILITLLSCQNEKQETSTENRAPGTQRPNIIFIMSDDHAAPAISAYKGFLAEAFKTPNIDRIANEGILFENAFCTNSICTPSRANILTGKYSHKNGVYTLVEKLSDDQETFVKLLQKSGYYTGIIGKWHLHTEPKGFDYWKVMIGQGRYHDPIYCEMGKGWSMDDEDGTGTVYKGYVTDINTEFGLDFLENRPKDKPFCLLLHYKAPHDPWNHSEKYNYLFADSDLPEPATLFDDYATRGDGIKNCTQKIGQNHTYYEEQTGHLKGKERKKAQYQIYMKKYLRCVKSVDDNIGRVLKFLDENGLADNTIISYTGDQGFYLGEHGMYDKRFMYEESLRMPFLVRYPNGIKAGQKTDEIITNVDFAETFLDYAGVEIPADMQGRSLRPIMEGNTPHDWPQAMYYRYWMHGAHFNIPGHYGVRTKDYKLIFFYGKGLGYSHSTRYPSGDWQFEGNKIVDTDPYWEMYDLNKDPDELNNVYDDPAYADIQNELTTLLFELKKTYDDKDDKYPEMYALTKDLSEK
jgi:arylsulfatase A-like enzyme